jgi:predicted ester cyclase
MSDVAALTTALTDAYNDHDLRCYEALHESTARISFAGVSGDIGLEPWLDTLGRLFDALPDLTIRPVTMLADEHTALVELQQNGTNTGVLQLTDGDRALLATDAPSLPPTGRRIDVSGVVALTVADRRVTGERHHWPRFWLHEGLGLVTVAANPINRWSTRLARPPGPGRTNEGDQT